MKLKDKEHIEALIKISKRREHYKDGNSYCFKNRLICIEIKKFGTKTSTCFKDNKKGRKELLKFIQKECYI